MSATRSLPPGFLCHAAREQNTPVLFSEPQSEPIPISRSSFARAPAQAPPHMFDSDGSDEDADMPMPEPRMPGPRMPEPGSPSESLWCHVTGEQPERTEGARPRYSGVQSQSHGTPDSASEDMPVCKPLFPPCSTLMDGDACSGRDPTPVEDNEDEQDHASPLMFQWENDEPEQSSPSTTANLEFSDPQPAKPPFAEHQGHQLDRSALFSLPVTETSAATARGVFTMPYHSEHDGPASPAVIGSASGAHRGPATREAGHQNPVPLTPSLHAHGANMNTGIHPGSPPPPYPPIPKHPRLPISPTPPYMPTRDRSGQPLSPLENSAMNTEAVVRFAVYARSLCPPVADPNCWILFFDALMKILSYVMRQSPHIASFWSLIIFCCLMVAHELGCRRRLLRYTWSRVMRLRGFRWEYTRRSKISIVDHCRARILQLVTDELVVNRFLNMQRIKSTGYMAFGHGPAQANATSRRPCFQPQTNMPFSFFFPAEIPQLVFDLMGGQLGPKSYESVCYVLRVSHLLIHPPPTFPLPTPAPPVQVYHRTNIAPAATSGPDRPQGV